MWNSRVSAVARRLGLGQHLLQRVAIRALFLRQARVRAEHAGLPQDADVRRIDVLVGGEGDAVAVLRAVHRVGQCAEAEQVRRAEERDAVVVREPLAALRPCRRSGTAPDREIARAVERDGGAARSTPGSA